MHGAAVEDYLKIIYKLSTTKDRVNPSLVAERLGVTSAAVTKMVKRLKQLRMVRYARSDGLTLTALGKKAALEIVRHHRLLELYLAEALGYRWDEVHEEAEKLEHAISEHFAEKIEKFLGFPTHDPHGDPIPTRDGRVESAAQTTLADLEPGDRALIERVNDADAGMLAYLGGLGMYPGTVIEILGRSPFGGPYRVRVMGRDHEIGEKLASNVFVSWMGKIE